jgi:PBP1b-binding outer membrane lipoprotein LpoB
MNNRTSLIALTMLALAFAGCSKHSPDTAASPRSAFDLVQSGKDTKWADGSVLHVTQRDGTSLRGVQVDMMISGGEKRVLTAGTGTIQRVGADTIMLMLTDAKVQFGDGSISNYPGNFSVELYRYL